MSIAVSAIVHPSRLLFIMLVAIVALTGSVGIVIGFGAVGELSFVPRLTLATTLVFLAFFGFYHGRGYGKPIHIDISGTGQLRVAVVSGEGACTEANWPHVRHTGVVVRLMKKSTIWPYLLLLHLQTVDKKTLVVVILPDCVPRDSFRALSVACRWVAAQKNVSEQECF